MLACGAVLSCTQLGCHGELDEHHGNSVAGSVGCCLGRFAQSSVNPEQQKQKVSQWQMCAQAIAITRHAMIGQSVKWQSGALHMAHS